MLRFIHVRQIIKRTRRSHQSCLMVERRHSWCYCRS